MKLVRDKIPDIASHRTFRKAEPCELIKLVTDKVTEETKELLEAIESGDKLQMIEEMADVCEILLKLTEVLEIDMDLVRTMAMKKNGNKGKFDSNVVMTDE